MPTPRSHRFFVLALLALSLAARSARGAAPPPSEIDIAFDVEIPMRDGVSLSGALYLPRSASSGARIPAILWLTPYGIDSFHSEATALARRGFAVAAVDVRGRGNSRGIFEPWNHDGRDGHDVVEWLARRPWSSGRVGMLGHSYGGRAVWSTLREAPPHLAAAVSISASNPMISWRNLLGPDTLQWLLLNAGVTSNARLASDSRLWFEKYRELYVSRRPLREFDRLFGTPSPLFQRFLDHPTLDEFWSSVTPSAEDFARLDLPILSIVGENEGNARAALWYVREHHRLASPAARAKHRVLIGPWDHSGARRPSASAGGLTFGPASEVDMIALLAGWFGATLRGEAREETPPLVAAPITYYVAGPETWRRAPGLDDLGAERHAFFLRSNGSANALARPGRLAAATALAAPDERRHDSWLYDPLDLRPGLAETPETIEATDWAIRFDAPDDLFGQGVVYATDPFLRNIDLVGFPRAKIWFSLDVPDTDLYARLDLLGESGLVFLGEDWMRARYRHSLVRGEPVVAGEPFAVDFEFPWNGRTLPAGSRLRLVLWSHSSILYGKNWNGGGEVAAESAKDARTAHVVVWHDDRHPSRLEVDLVATHGPAPR